MVFRDALLASLVNSWVGPLILRGSPPSSFRDPRLAELVYRVAESVGLVRLSRGGVEVMEPKSQPRAGQALVRPLQTIWNRLVYPALVRGERGLASDVEQALHRVYRALQPLRLAALSEMGVRGRLVLVAGYHPCGLAIDVLNVGADLVLVEELEAVLRFELALMDGLIPQVSASPGPSPAPGAFYIFANAPLSAVPEIARLYGANVVVLCHQPRSMGDPGLPVESLVFRGSVGAFLDMISYLLGLGVGPVRAGRVVEVGAG